MENAQEEANYDKEKELIEQASNDSGAHLIMDLPEALKIVGVGEKYIGNMDHILKEYQAMYLVHEENHEIEEKLDDLLIGRNVIIRTNLLTQIYDKGAFMVPENPFENTCKKCHGTGELYLFNRVPKEVNCNRCEDGIVWVRCRSCKGTTRYTSKFKEGGGINVECKTCKESPEEHKGQVAVKCRVCQGTKIAKIMVLDHTLKSTTPCPACDELGFTIPKQEKVHVPQGLDNPVLAGDLAEKLKHQIDDAKFFDAPKQQPAKRD